MARTIAGTLLLISGGLLLWHLATREETSAPVAGTLWGRVCDHAEHRIAFATVRLSAGDELLEVTHTNEYGFFGLSYSAPGGAKLTLEARGHGYEPGRYFIRAGEGSPVRVEIAAHHRLALTVRYSDGSPVPSFRTVVSASPSRPGRPGPGGMEAIDDHESPDGRATLTLQCPVVDLVVIRRDHPPIRMDDVDLTTDSSDGTRHLDVQLERGATVHGQVRVLEDWGRVSLRIAAIPWSLREPPERSGPHGFQEAWIAVNEKSAPFVINGLEPGYYEVAVVHGRRDFLSGSVTVCVQGAESVGPIELVCGYAAPVAVRVAFGSTPAGGDVALIREAPGDVDERWLPWNPEIPTDAFARAVFPEVPAGRYRVRLRQMWRLGKVPWGSGPVDAQLQRLYASAQRLAAGLEMLIDYPGRRPQTFNLDASSCLDGYLEWIGRTGRDRIRGKLRALTVEFSCALPDELERVGIDPAELPYYEIESSLLAIEDMVAQDDSALSHLEPPLVTALRARDVCGILEALLEY